MSGSVQHPNSDEFYEAALECVHAADRKPMDDRLTVAEIVGLLVCSAIDVYTASKEDDE